MNIAAVMATLDIWDLDRNAKHALLVLACRADQHTAMAEVSFGRVAADMKIGYYGATHALERVVESGYLTVDKSPGQVPLWMLTSAVNLDSVESVPLATLVERLGRLSDERMRQICRALEVAGACEA